MNPVNRDRPLPQLVIDAGEDIDRLRSIIRYPDYEVREGAAWVLGTIGKFECLTPLANALKDPDAIVRESAAKALGNIKDLPNIHRKLGMFEDTPDDISAMNELTRALKDREYRVRVAAANSLVSYGKNVENLQGPQSAVQEPEPVKSPLPPSLYQPYSFSNSGMEEVLRPKKDYPPLVRNKPIPKQVIDANFSLAQLREVAKSKETDVREAVAWALGVMADTDGAVLLINALHDPEPAVRESAARSLGQLKFVSDTKQSVGRFEDKRGDQQVTENLLKALKDKELNVRATAAAALANYGKPEIAKQLLVLLKDSVPNMRAAAAVGLGGCAYPEVVPALILRLKDEDFWTRLCSARSLGRLKDPVALEFLMDGLHDHNPSVRQNVVRALIEMGENGVGDQGFWHRALDQFIALGSMDSSEVVQEAAREAVVRLKSRLIN